jgi:hypothetical protein
MAPNCMNRNYTLASLVFVMACVVSCSRTNTDSIVETKRLIVPADEGLEKIGEGLKFRGEFWLETRGEPVLLTDPTYLADVYNSKDDEKATYVREHGVLLLDFGGDTGSPVWWRPPYLILPLSMHYKADLSPGEDVKVFAREVSCDSGSFVFLPVTDEMPTSLKKEIQEVIQKGHGALLPLPPGRYSFFYEQFDAPQSNMASMYRNIVVRKD